MGMAGKKAALKKKKKDFRCWQTSWAGVSRMSLGQRDPTKETLPHPGVHQLAGWGKRPPQGPSYLNYFTSL